MFATDCRLSTPQYALPSIKATPRVVAAISQPMACAKGKALVCADGTRMAGPGEHVYFEDGREAALSLDPWFVPVDHSIVGIVDGVHVQEPEA